MRGSAGRTLGERGVGEGRKERNPPRAEGNPSFGAMSLQQMGWMGSELWPYLRVGATWPCCLRTLLSRLNGGGQRGKQGAASERWRRCSRQTGTAAAAAAAAAATNMNQNERWLLWHTWGYTYAAGPVPPTPSPLP